MYIYIYIYIYIHVVIFKLAFYTKSYQKTSLKRNKNYTDFLLIKPFICYIWSEILLLLTGKINQNKSVSLCKIKNYILGFLFEKIFDIFFSSHLITWLGDVELVTKSKRYFDWICISNFL